MQLSRIIKILDTFVPEHVRSNPSDLTRAYILLGVVFTNILSGILSAIGIFTFLDLSSISHYAIACAFLVLFTGYVLTIVIFKKTKSYQRAGNILVASVSGLISVAVCLSGGYRASPILQVLMVIPVMGFLLTGLHDGIKWLIVTLLVCIVLYQLSVMGIGYVQLISSPKDLEMMFTGLQIMVILVIGAALIVYEVINENLKNKLNAERDEFKRRASYDSLTGIPNRFEFFRRLQSGLVECHDRHQKLAVAYIDLNRFKPVNDQYGHHAGDIVLQEISKRLQGALRLSDTAARIGGDEFGLVLPGIHVPEDLSLIMQKIEKAINEPINIGSESVRISASAGIAIFPDNGTDMDVLCRYADSGMYENKNRGKSSGANFRQ